jgi:hypothetical protein
MNATTHNVDTSRLQSKIAALNVEIDELAQMNTLEASRAAQRDLATMIPASSNLNPEYSMVAFEEACEGASLATSVDQRDRLLETLATPLMHITCNWLITETPSLVSPAGFNASDRVFVATDVQTNCATANEAMRHAADGRIALYLHDMSKVSK